jgi:hypothetical protein
LLAESFPLTASFGGIPPLKSSGLVASMTTLPHNVSAPAILSALSFATPSVARTTTSPNVADPQMCPRRLSRLLPSPSERLLVSRVSRAHLHVVVAATLVIGTFPWLTWALFSILMIRKRETV